MKSLLSIIFLISATLTLNAQTEVNCAVGAVNTTYCYTNFDNTSFVFVSSNGSDLRVSFNAGQVELDWDQLVVLDTNGTELYNGYGNNGDLTGLSFVPPRIRRKHG